MGDGCPQMAAALAYYTVFSLPALLVLVILIVEPLIDPEAIRAAVEGQAGGLLGREAGSQVQTVLENIRRPGQGALFPAVVGIVAFAFGATAAFAQLQNALNATWQVGPDPTRGDVKNFLLKRVLSFTMILAIGFLLIVSLAVGAVLTAFGDAFASIAPAWLSRPLLDFINAAVSFTVYTGLFAAMFRFLPDARVLWKHAVIGGAMTATLFTLGKFAIGLYLGQSDPGSVYGAAGSLAIIMIWVYFSSMILLFGAEFTQVWARWRGMPIQPEPGAVHIIQTQERLELPTTEESPPQGEDA